MADDNKTPDLDLNTLAKRVGALEKENVTLKKQVATLTKTSSSVEIRTEREKLETPKDTFTVEGKKYQFTVPAFLAAGQRMTAVDALTDENVLAQLVAIDSGLIQEVK